MLVAEHFQYHQGFLLKLWNYEDAYQESHHMPNIRLVYNSSLSGESEKRSILPQNQKVDAKPSSLPFSQIMPTSTKSHAIFS